METYRADPLIFEMVRYASATYPRLVQESGQEIGWRKVGRVMYTDCEKRWASMRTLPELGRARNMVIELMTPKQTQARLPIISAEDLVGAVWVPSDARVNPTDAVMAFAGAARAMGVSFHQDALVTGIEVSGGMVRGVNTSSGTISCETVVVAAGLWSSEIVKTCGLKLPLHALEHQYLITEPAGIDRDLPLFLSYDDQIYGREEVGGLLVGSLDDNAIPLSHAELPQNFSFSLLNERWAQFEPYMETAMRRFPLLKGADIKMLLNGPESFTPDGQMLLGPVPGATGLFVTCGFNSNGMALAPAAGKFIAEWIVEGEPSADVAPLDVRRFSPAQADDEYMRERVTEIPGYHCRMHAADEDYTTSRDKRLSPLHRQLEQPGARFGSVNAWERPLWFGGSAEAPSCFDAVAIEVRAATDRVLLVDRSADVKHLLIGATTLRSWLADRFLIALPTGDAMVTPIFLPGDRGQIEVFTRLIASEPGRYLATACPQQEARLAEWLRRANIPEGVASVEVTSSYVLLELHGPLRGPLVSAILSASNTTGDAVVVREDDIRKSTLLIAPSESAERLWQRLTDAGPEFGLRMGGHFAEEALRIRYGIPGFGREATPARQTFELQPKLHPVADRSVPRTHVPRVLVGLTGSMPVLGFGSGDVVLLKNRTIGELTSRVWLPKWPAALALALLDPNQWSGEAVEVIVEGRRWPMVPRSTHWSSAPGQR